MSRICYLVSDLGGCGQYRCILVGKELAKQYGWDVEIHHGMPPSIPTADLYVFQRQTNPQIAVIARELRRAGKVVLGEVDDWFPSIPSHFPGRYPIGYVDSIIANLRACDSVTVSTPGLAEGYAGYGMETHCIRNYLSWPMWEGKQVQSVGRLRIGYMGLLLSHHPDLRVLQGVIGPWLRQNPDVRFVAAGGGEELADALDIPIPQRVMWPAVKWEHLADITATMDVGLVPLKQSRFNEGKSCLKALEMASCGIPSVASPTPENNWLAERLSAVRITRNATAAWRHALESFLGLSDSEWAGMRANCREVARELSIDRHVDEWNDRFTAALDAGPRPVTEPSELVVVKNSHAQLEPGETATYRIEGRDFADMACPECGTVYSFDAVENGISGSMDELTADKPVSFECCGSFRLRRGIFRAGRPQQARPRSDPTARVDP